MKRRTALKICLALATLQLMLLFGIYSRKTYLTKRIRHTRNYFLERYPNLSFDKVSDYTVLRLYDNELDEQAVDELTDVVLLPAFLSKQFGSRPSVGGVCGFLG